MASERARRLSWVLSQTRQKTLTRLPELPAVWWTSRSAWDGRPARVVVHELGERSAWLAGRIAFGAVDPALLEDRRADHSKRRANCTVEEAVSAFGLGTVCACDLIARLGDDELDRTVAEGMTVECAIQVWLVGDTTEQLAALGIRDLEEVSEK